MSPGMQTRQKKAGLVLGVVFLMIPARWAAAAEGAAVAAAAVPVEGSTPAVDDERPASNPGPPRRMAVDPDAPQVRPPRLMVDPLTIEGASFYDAVGRPDLADSYRARHGWAVASRVVGGLSLGLGMLTWVAVQALVAGVELPVCVAAPDSMACHQGPGTLWVPDIMMAAGLTLLVVPAAWSNDPVSEDEKADLAREAASGVASAPRRVSWNVSAAPLPGGQGGAVALSGRF
jgi:hypothetical protein